MHTPISNVCKFQTIFNGVPFRYRNLCRYSILCVSGNSCTNEILKLLTQSRIQINDVLIFEAGQKFQQCIWKSFILVINDREFGEWWQTKNISFRSASRILIRILLSPFQLFILCAGNISSHLPSLFHLKVWHQLFVLQLFYNNYVLYYQIFYILFILKLCIHYPTKWSIIWERFFSYIGTAQWTIHRKFAKNSTQVTSCWFFWQMQRNWSAKWIHVCGVIVLWFVDRFQDKFFFLTVRR